MGVTGTAVKVCVSCFPLSYMSEALLLKQELTRIPLLLKVVQPANPCHRRKPL